MNEKDYQLSEEELKKLQRKDAIQNNEDYDIDMEIHSTSPPSVEKEKIEPQKPDEQEEKALFEEVDSKYLYTDDEMEKINKENLTNESPEYEDSSKATNLKSGKDENLKNREYLNRKETIFKDPNIPFPLKKIPTSIVPKLKKNKIKQKNKCDYSNIATGFMSIIFVLLIVFLFLIFWRITSNTSNLSETEKNYVVEMSTFLSYNEKYIAGMNELSEEKKTLLESYIKGVRNKKELAMDLLAIKNKENQVNTLFTDDNWSFDKVNTAHNMTEEYMKSNITLSNDLINMLGENAEKGQLIDTYNTEVNSQTSKLYTLNEYIRDSVNQLGVPTITEGNIIQIDLTEIK